MMSMRFGSIAAGAGLALALFSGTAAHAQSADADLGSRPFGLIGDEPGYLDFGAGAFNIQNHGEVSSVPEARVEFRAGGKLYDIGPAMGFLVNTDGGVFGYVGGYADIAWGHLVLTPLFGFGAYSPGRGTGGENLGGTFEFRGSAALAYEFDDRTRLGVQFAHISNAKINDNNPGDNELLATYAIPISFGL